MSVLPSKQKCNGVNLLKTSILYFPRDEKMLIIFHKNCSFKELVHPIMNSLSLYMTFLTNGEILNALKINFKG